jgi:hypothetical protein
MMMMVRVDQKSAIKRAREREREGERVCVVVVPLPFPPSALPFVLLLSHARQAAPHSTHTEHQRPKRVKRKLKATKPPQASARALLLGRIRGVKVDLGHRASR